MLSLDDLATSSLLIMSSDSAISSVRVAAVQAEPVWLDLPATVKKTCQLISEAASNGAKLIAFPECWIPGYPCWIWARPVDPALGVRYIQNSLRVDSPEMETIRAAAAEHSINVVLGYSEKDGNSLYISQCTISGEDGTILMKRRKLKPTHMERTVFGDASGDSLLNVVDIPNVGKVGALACWEHIQPLLKYHTYLQKEEIHVSAWPSLDKFIEGSPGLWGMSREGCLGQSQQYAVEGGAFVIHSTAVISERGVQLMETTGAPIFNKPGGGCSAIFGPDGRRLTEPLEDTEEGIVYADLDLTKILASA
ncbi:carbon-nitrogen hydrolase [Dactylonectria macrodidyma]|uniref:nitrilase n=1 Tax=Dactylonectria macrodidyma TaxID=307937 RepID=A0A9P9DLQ2_9HYPO|nr:carbon-nitrogen hydrolase [Dactylonectria macrodidyma]